jgi:uncharacterized protein
LNAVFETARLRARTLTMKRISKYALAAASLVLVGFAAPAAAGDPLIDGLAAADRGDLATAIRLLRPLADQGDAVIQGTLADMYYQGGGGVPQSYMIAASWYRRAADQYEPSSQYKLGLMYVNGLGVPQDYVLAHMWFNLAAAMEYKYAATNRDMLAAKMTPEQIAEAQKLAREWEAKFLITGSGR